MQYLSLPIPDCVSVRLSSSGLHELFFVRGRLFKTVRSAVDTEWIAGLRPVGSDYLPPPVRALAVLDRMYWTWRQRSGLTKLVVGFVGPAGISKAVPAPIASWVNRCQRRFFAGMGISDWDISSHQWRKAFAQYVIRADSLREKNRLLNRQRQEATDVMAATLLRMRELERNTDAAIRKAVREAKRHDPDKMLGTGKVVRFQSQ